ncbi:MAG: serine/threonine-protein kinase [Planctomycetota bacterium]|nr:serine/threonine-protein kinase [Planctomycetota bacterium]
MTRESRRKPDAPIDLPRIPGYRIEGILGRGASGVVYSGIQETIERAVALKILRADLVRSTRAVERFRREARTAARLAHQAIIAPIDLGQLEDGRWWYAMELVEGISLGERIEERGALDEREALRMFIPLADALQHLREVGVVHRDVKPANILIDPRERAMLADLGLAFARDEPSLTGSGGVLGTPHYVSPEQARDSSKVDSRSDIWSLGATMYHAVTGRPPFTGSSVAEVFSSVLQDPLVDPRRFAPDLSASFVVVLRACLTRDLAHRYQEPFELRDDLQRLLERRAPEVSREGLEPLEQTKPWSKRILVGVAVLLLAGGLSWWKVMPEDDPQETTVRAGDPLIPLQVLENSYEEGRIRPVALLERIADWPRPGGKAPDGILGSRLQTLNIRAHRDLGESLRNLEQELEPVLEGALERRNWVAAQHLLLRELPRKLLEGAGCASTESLPDAQESKSFVQWEKRWQGRLQTHLDERLQEVVRTGRRWIQDEVAPHVAQALANQDVGLALTHSRRSVSEALAALQSDWEGLPETRVRDALTQPVETRLTELEQDVRDHWDGLSEDLIAFIDVRAQVHSKRIDEDLLEGLDQELRNDFDVECERLGLDLEKVPSPWKQDVLDLREVQGERLRREGRGKRLAVASNEWERDLAQSQDLYAARQYGQVADLWSDRLASPWRISMFPAMERELREARLLEELLERCARSLAKKNGQQVFLVIENFRQEGTLVESLSALDRGVVFLHGARRERKALALRSSSDQRGPILGTSDVLRLAAGAPDTDSGGGMTNERALARALFLFHEGDLQGARDALPREEAMEDPLTRDLERRILRSLTQGKERSREQWIVILAALTRDVESGGQASRRAGEQIATLLAEPGLDPAQVPRLEQLRVRAEANRGARTLEDLYPDAKIIARGPELASRRNVHLGWLFDSPPESWALGRFQARPGHLHLAVYEGVGEGSSTWLQDPLTLAVASPLETQRPMGFTLHFRFPEDAPASPVVLSLGGYHLVFVTDGSESRFLGGSGDAEELLRNLENGQSTGQASFAGFQPGVYHRLQVQLTALAPTRKGRVQAILLDDVELKVPAQVSRPATSSILEFSSRGELDLYRVEVKASEIVGR